MSQPPDRNFAMDLVRVTEAAALASARWLGRGDKNAGDGAAVDAMRRSFDALNIDGVVVIGEGEKDEAPMLYNGERLGTGQGPAMDVAVDPVEGTRLLAYGRPNAISVVGVAPGGAMFRPGPSYYMKKLVVPAEAKGLVDLNAPVAETLKAVAQSIGKDLDDLTVFVLDKPRHERLITDIRATGARIALHTDGDVAGSLMAIDPHSEIDVMMGTGGTPEGVLSACAIRSLGGWMLASLDPQSVSEAQAVRDAGLSTQQVLTAEDLVAGEDVFFAATGITSGELLRGVRYLPKGAVTHSLCMRGKTGAVRYIETRHSWERLMKFSAVKYD